MIMPRAALNRESGETRIWSSSYRSNPSSETQGQSVGSGKKAGQKFSSTGERAPLVPTPTGLFLNIQAVAGPWWGTKNALYYWAQSANSFSWVLFVSSYTTAIVSPHLPGSFTKLVRARETFIFYFPNQKIKELPMDMSRKTVWDAISWSNWICPEYSVFGGSQYIVNNRKFKMWRRRESQISNSFTGQNNNFARASPFFVHFFAVNGTTTRENA